MGILNMVLNMLFKEARFNIFLSITALFNNTPFPSTQLVIVHDMGKH
jgi:hypothetical protein